mgnify:CR=1 FL=1
MSASLAHSGAFIAPCRGLTTPSGSRHRVRARVMVTPTAKGQKGVRKVVQSGAASLSFNPGSVLSKMMNVTKNKINWKVLNDAADKLDGELASQPILGLVRAEVTIRGIDTLETEGRGYKEYILLRSLGLKAWFTHATSRAGVHDPLTRCAVGKQLATPDNDFNIYRRVLTHAPMAANDDWVGFANGLAEDAKSVADTLTDDDVKTAKNRYDKSIDENAFVAIDESVKKAAELCAGAKRGDPPVATAVAISWVDPGAAPATARPKAGVSPGGDSPTETTVDTEEETEEEDSFESMFGKKAKKKNKGGAAPSLDAVLSQLIKKQQEPTFPEVDAWITKGGQATASEAVAAALAMCLEAPEGAVVVAPSALFASAVSFDTGSLGNGRRLIAPGQAAGGTVEWGERAVFIAFEPDSCGADATLAKGVKSAVDAGAGVVVVAVALVPGGDVVDAAVSSVRERAKI